MKKFNEIPFWVYDKHVPGGTKGYKFFFENSLVVNEAIYEDMWGEGGDKYAEECKHIIVSMIMNIAYIFFLSFSNVTKQLCLLKVFSSVATFASVALCFKIF